MTEIRYLIKTARGYFRAEESDHPGPATFWTRYPEEASQWTEVMECHHACRKYTQSTGESAVVVVQILPTATLSKAVPKSA